MNLLIWVTLGGVVVVEMSRFLWKSTSKAWKTVRHQPYHDKPLTKSNEKNNFWFFFPFKQIYHVWSLFFPSFQSLKKLCFFSVSFLSHRLRSIWCPLQLQSDVLIRKSWEISVITLIKMELFIELRRVKSRRCQMFIRRWKIAGRFIDSAAPSTIFFF